MTNDKKRPSLDAAIIDALTAILVPSGLPDAVPLGEVTIDNEFVFGIGSAYGFSEDEIERRIDYFISEGVLRRRACADSSVRIVSFVDLDMEAQRLGVADWFSSAKSKK